MSVVMTVSGKPGFASLHYVWLTFVGQTIASWCFLVSVLAPYLQKPFEPPMAVETYASRYRLLTPEPSSPRSRSCSLTDKGLTDAGGQPTNQPIVEAPQPVEEPTSGSRDRRTSKRFSFAAAGIAFYDFSVHPLRRSNSMSVVNQKKKTASTRPRSRSDPTDTKEREPHRVGRCMTFATAFAAKHTSPARPFVKRARTVFQRSLAQGNSKSSDSDSETDVESDFVTIPRAFFQSARTGTRKAYHCSTSAATTAFRKVSPDSKAAASDLSRKDVQKVAKGESTEAALPATEEVPGRRRRSPLCPKSFKLFSKKRASI